MLLEVLNASVGIKVKRFDKIPAVKFEPLPDVVFRFGDGLVDPADGSRGHPRSLNDGIQHEKDETLPVSPLPDFIELAIVFPFVADDVPAQVENGGVKQLLEDEIQDVHDAASPPVSVVERVDGLELVVDDGHFEQRIDIRPRTVVIDDSFQISEKRDNFVPVLRRRVDHFAGCPVLDGRSRLGPNPGRIVFQTTLDGANVVDGQQLAPLDEAKSLKQGIGVIAHLFCLERRGFFRSDGRTVQFVVRRHDVFDFRTVFRLLQTERVNQNISVGDRPGKAVESRQLAIGVGQAFENFLGLKVDWRWYRGRRSLKHAKPL